LAGIFTAGKNYIISGVIICLLNAYRDYVYWDKYQALFKK